MAKVIITESLRKEIEKIFKDESRDIFQRMKSLERNPKRGKLITEVSETQIRELKYKKYRFYFITDGRMLKVASEDELSSLLIKFVRMSGKKDQGKVIKEIKEWLRDILER